MPNTIIAWKYTSDKGTVYVTGVNQELATQTDGAGLGTLILGGTACTTPANFDELARGVRRRQAAFARSGARMRYVPVFTPAALAAMTAGTTLAIEDSDGASNNYTFDHTVAEKMRRRRAQQA